MINNKYYVGFPTSETLSNHATTLFKATRCNPDEKQEELLAKVLCQLSHETIDVYLMDVFKSAGVSRTQARIINSADNILKRTANTVIKQTSKKLNTKQQQRIAEHIESSFLAINNTENHHTSLIVYAVNSTFYDKLITDHNKLKNNSSEISTATVINNQEMIMDKMLENQVERLISIVQLGPILKKIVRVAVDKSVDMMKSTHQKLLNNMTREELINANQHYIEMLFRVPVVPITE